MVIPTAAVAVFSLLFVFVSMSPLQQNKVDISCGSDSGDNNDDDDCFSCYCYDSKITIN